MNLTNHIEQVLLCLSFVLLSANVLYLFVFSMSGWLAKTKMNLPGVTQQQHEILVIFPAYQEDAVIIEATNSMLLQDYPKSKFTVYVIADSFQDETISKLQSNGIEVLVIPPSANRNKARAINYLFNQLTKRFDVCVVMDADNVVSKTFLQQVNGYFNKGVQVLQTMRIAKNTKGELAQLDAFSECINNHIFRKGQVGLGFSASLIGSGMAFNFDLFKSIMKEINVYSGFDKELELRILEQKVKIEFAPEILVLDEKVSKYSVFVNQRRRWIYAQYDYLFKNMRIAMIAIFNGNFDYVNKVVQFMLFPRIITIGFSFLLLMSTCFFFPQWILPAFTMVLLLVVALLIPIRKDLMNINVPSISVALFSSFFHMLFAVFTAKSAAGKFLHTPHNSN